LIATAEGPLSQGDLVVLDVLPVWNLQQAKPLGDTYQGAVVVPAWRSGAVPYPHGLLCAVCSHDCDLDNPSQRYGLQVAPLATVPANPRREQERFESVVGSAKRNAAGEFDWIWLFPVRFPAELDVKPEWGVIDMSAITTIAPATDAHERLTAARVAAMSEEEASDFRTKIAAQFGRDYQARHMAADGDGNTA
jgi:hypothetical protein